MRACLTWGIGHSKSKVLAIRNARASANLEKIKIRRLPALQIPKCEIVENKSALEKLKGEFKGIVLQNCAKGEAAASLVLSLAEDSIAIGHGKAGGLVKAERIAESKAKRAAKGKKLEGTDYHISARAPPKKGEYGCAIVGLVLADSKNFNNRKAIKTEKSQ